MYVLIISSCIMLIICQLTLQSSRSMLSRLLLRWTRPLILRSDGFPWLTSTPGGTAPDEVAAASELGGILGHKRKTHVYIIINYKQSSITEIQSVATISDTQQHR